MLHSTSQHCPSSAAPCSRLVSPRGACASCTWPRMAHIPGLGAHSYAVGSWHQAPTPTLLRSETTAAAFDFAWSASGTAVYSVTATGALRKSAAAPGGVRLEALEVQCSCPDGVRQLLLSKTGGKLYVCKHGAAALASVLDPAVKAHEAEAAKLLERQLAAAQAAAAAERVKQDAQMPGERARIQHALTNRSAEDVVKLFRSRITTLDGLRAAAALFPADVFPPPSMRHCRRCGKDYDSNIPTQLVCQVHHPDGKVSRRWDDSKHSYSECSTCGKTFDLDGYSSRRRRDDPVEQGPYCWQGEHKAEGEAGSDSEGGSDSEDDG